MTRAPAHVRDGQPFVDEPTFTTPKPIAAAVAGAFESRIPAIQTGVERVKLRWMEPDGKGGLRPRRRKQQ